MPTYIDEIIEKNLTAFLGRKRFYYFTANSFVKDLIKSSPKMYQAVVRAAINPTYVGRYLVGRPAVVGSIRLHVVTTRKGAAVNPRTYEAVAA